MRCFPALKRCSQSSPLRRFPPNRQRTAKLPPAIAVECWASGNPLRNLAVFIGSRPSPASGLLGAPARGSGPALAEPKGCWCRGSSQGSGLQGTARRAPWPLLRNRYIHSRMPQPLRALRSAAVAEIFWYGWVLDPPPFASRFLIQPAKIS